MLGTRLRGGAELQAAHRSTRGVAQQLLDLVVVGLPLWGAAQGLLLATRRAHVSVDWIVVTCLSQCCMPRDFALATLVLGRREALT